MPLPRLVRYYTSQEQQTMNLPSYETLEVFKMAVMMLGEGGEVGSGVERGCERIILHF